MAIAFSLPHALFVYRYGERSASLYVLSIQALLHSMLTFLFSICWIFFWQTSITTRAILGALLGILVALVSLVIFLDWRPSQEHDTIYRKIITPLLAFPKSISWAFNFPGLAQTLRESLRFVLPCGRHRPRRSSDLEAAQDPTSLELSEGSVSL